MIVSNGPCSLALCLLSGVYESVFGFLGFHLEVVTLLIWNLINSAAFQSALTLTQRLHPSWSSTIAVSSSAPAPLKAFHMKPADLLGPRWWRGWSERWCGAAEQHVCWGLTSMSSGLPRTLSSLLSDGCLICLQLRKQNLKPE